MKLDVWTDIICPWCWLGKARLEKAAAQSGLDIEIVWRSFELDPRAPAVVDGTLNEMLAKKYGMSPARAKASHDHLTELGAADGLAYRFDIARPGNTFDAHRLVHFARSERGESGARDMQARLMQAYFHDGVTIGERASLVAVAKDAGYDEAKVRAMLEGDAFASDVRADEELARDVGINGVPCVVDFASKLAVSGAQEVDVFLGMIKDAAVVASTT